MLTKFIINMKYCIVQIGANSSLVMNRNGSFGHNIKAGEIATFENQESAFSEAENIAKNYRSRGMVFIPAMVVMPCASEGGPVYGRPETKKKK